MGDRALVPSQGYATFIQVEHAVVQYALIGPVAVNAFLLELEVVYQTSGGGVFDFAASVARTPEATLVGLQSGLPAIQRGDYVTGGIGGMQFTLGGSGFGRFRLPLGVWAGDAVRHVVFVVGWAGTDETIGVLVGLRTMRAVERGEGLVQG